MTAAAEHNIRSPMVEAGMDKAQVRAAALWLGVPLWDKPAQPCLSSRIPYGTPVTVESLRRIEAAEDILRDLGLREVRARHHDKLCRIEVGADEMELAFAHRDEITRQLKALGYLWVSLDLSGLRSGSLNDVLRKSPLPRGRGQIPGMKTAFIQSVGGASGDMLLGALLDAGLSRDAVSETIDALCIPGVDIAAGTETRCEVRGTRVLVDVSAAPRYSPAQMLDTVAGADGLSERTRELATKVLNALFAAEARVHGGDPDQIHLHELGTADTLVDVVGVVHGLEQLGVGRVYAAPLVLGEPTGPRRSGGYSNPAPATLEIIAAAGAPWRRSGSSTPAPAS